MFYSQFILAKKGPLGTIWIAAHLERKLRKNQVAETNIGVSVDSILFPEVPIALRLSGHLLLGVVRIYSRKVNYLFHDCSEALVKIKQAFHSTIVDLPPEAATAPFHSITLPETFDFDELELLQDTQSSFVQSNGNLVDHHVTSREQITLQDNLDDTLYLSSSQFGLDERFVDADSSPMGLDFDEDFFAEKPHFAVASPPQSMLKEDILPSMTGGADEAIQMDTDDYHEPSTPIRGLDRIEAEERGATPVFELDRIQVDGTQNMSSLASLLDPLSEAILDRASSKVSDSLPLDDSAPSFNARVAQTPPLLEARTPDLNQEFCPPDEPSTPALPEETSSPIDKEVPLSSGFQERLFPDIAGSFERATSDEQCLISMPSSQTSVLLPLGESRQESLIPTQFSSPNFKQHLYPSAGSGRSNTWSLPQQVTMVSQPQPSSPNAAAFIPSQRFGVNPVQKASIAVEPPGTSLSDPFAGSELSRALPHQATIWSQVLPAAIVTSQNITSCILSESFGVKPVQKTSSLSAPFQGFPVPTSLQELTTGSYQNSSVDTPNPLVPTMNYDVPTPISHQPFASSSTTLNCHWSASTSNSGASSVYEQPRMLLNQTINMPTLTNNIASFHHGWAASAESGESSLGFPAGSLMQDRQFSMNDSTQKVSPVVPMTMGLHMTDGLPSSLASSRSFSPPAEESSKLAQTEKLAMHAGTGRPPRNQEQMAIQRALEPNEFSFSSASQQHIASRVTSLPFSPASVFRREEALKKPVLHERDIQQCETLRSKVESLREEPDFLFVRKGVTNEKTPALKVDKNNAHNTRCSDKLKDGIQPTLERTPILREETPFPANKSSPLPPRSFDSIPRDDDVLATILGRGASTFKVLRTPEENPVPKRRRTAPRSSPKKRKIVVDTVFDTYTVLHGDVIRQQLANTEDIRRVRKKAPSTRREMWGLSKEIQGQQIFCEPLLPGLSDDLHDLYHGVFSGNGARHPSSDACHAARDTSVIEIEGGIMEKDDKRVGMMSRESNPPVHSSEVIRTDGMILCEGMKRHDETGAMLSNESLFPHSQDSGRAAGETVTSQEPISISVGQVVNIPPIPKDAVEESVLKESPLSGGINLHSLMFLEGEPKDPAVELKAAEQAVVENNSGDCSICNSMDVKKEGNTSQVEVSSEIKFIALQEDKGGSENQVQVIYPAKDGQLPGVERKNDNPNSESAGVDVLNVQVNLESSRESSDGSRDVAARSNVDVPAMAAEIVRVDEKDIAEHSFEEVGDASKVDRELGFLADARDTEFLGEDDDVAYYEVDGFDDDASDEQDSLIEDNSGWSTRTRNVGRYLRAVFEGMEGNSRRSTEQEHLKLGIERLLIGKTKKEAARMFFETLVLKTREYIHVEQTDAFEDIYLYPRPKLMKASF